MRAEAEDMYGQKLGDIETSTNRIDGGFQRDDGASVKKVGHCGYTRHLKANTDSSRRMKACEQKWPKLLAITGRSHRMFVS